MHIKTLFIISFLILAIVFAPSAAFAQGLTENNASPTPFTDHTAREEAEGKALWEKLSAKQTSCDALTDDNFAALGEYFMGQMVGNAHASMNQMMVWMMGKTGEEQMHVIMGKRASECDDAAQAGAGSFGFTPMGWMMGGNGRGYTWSTMMNGWGGFGLVGGLSMLAFLALVVFGVIALFRSLARSGQPQEKSTPLEILKERYARGEISKKEFEDKKKEVM